MALGLVAELVTLHWFRRRLQPAAAAPKAIFWSRPVL